MINKEHILKEYLKWVEEISEDVEEKTYFSPEEIVYKVIELVEDEYDWL